MTSPGPPMALLATLAAVLGAALGLSMTALHASARVMVVFAGSLLAAVALFGLLPEAVEAIGMLPAALLLAAGYLLLLAIDRYVHPVCPACSHSHDHERCASELHGFAAPLLAAASLHAFLDGWSIATSQSAGAGLRMALPLAICFHKLPEGIALGGILRASIGSRSLALGACVAAESATLVGAVAGLAMAARVGSRWLHYPLAAAGGCFLYLGYHAVEAEWRKRRVPSRQSL